MATFSPGRKCSARKDANLRLSASNSAYVHCSPLSPAIAGTLSATWSGACSAACSSNCPTVQSRRGRCSSAATKAKPAPSETISHLSRQGSATEARPPMILSLKAHLLFRLKKVSYITICVNRSEEHTSELQSLMRISYAVFCLKKKKQQHTHTPTINH